MSPTVAAIVPATDRPPTLDRCLEAIRAAREPPEEVIAVTEPPGAGPAEARNAGAARATADLLVFVDSDVLVSADAIVRLRDRFGADPALSALFGSYDDRPEAPGVVSAFRNLLHHHVHQSSPGPASTFWAGLGCIRRDLFLAAGGFDARRYPVASIEDIELGIRLVDAGARIELDPGLQGTHLKRWSLTEAARTDFSRRGVPWVRLLAERRRIPDHLNLGWRHRASAVLALAGLGGLVSRRPRLAAATAIGLAALNRSFYALLLRRRGPLEAAAGVGLHALHHAVGAAAVPAGLVAEAAHGRGGQPSPARGARLGGGRPSGPDLVRAFADEYPDAFFIEIGANDGEQHDYLEPFIRTRRWRGIMVEPVPYVFERLQRNYGDLGRVALENVAIADRDGRLPFYYLDQAGEDERGELPEWYDALGSFSREMVLANAPEIPDIERRLVRSEVPCLTFESLCRRHGVDGLDLVVVDAEGFDYEIVKRIDFETYRPRMLIYEHRHLTAVQRAECKALLQRLGYETIEEYFDTWCLDTRVRDRLTA
jgi:FkbM family methyltransferase